MAHPWFFIRCPTCRQFWGERGHHQPGSQIVVPCAFCHRQVVILFGRSRLGVLVITHVSDAVTGVRGEWSPLLDNAVHWKEVN